jgi:dCMP deaminase
VREKHLQVRIAQCLSLSEASPCPRRKFGAMLVRPESNITVTDGYNGPPRGGGELCGGDYCIRDSEEIPSGQMCEVGCHHAETNAILNAARIGARTEGTWLIVTGEPCLMCAKNIHHAGVVRVVCVEGGYFAGDRASSGTVYLRDHGVAVEYVDGPKDPRLESICKEA